MYIIIIYIYLTIEQYCFNVEYFYLQILEKEV